MTLTEAMEKVLDLAIDRTIQLKKYSKTGKYTEERMEAIENVRKFWESFQNNFPRTVMKVVMIQQDLCQGERGNAFCCPAALAIQRDTGCKYVTVTQSRIRLYNSIDEGEEAIKVISTPEKVQQFIAAFDSYNDVEPISFELYI